MRGSIRFIALLFVAVTAQGATYYVAPDGNDSNPGSETLPWRTIAKASQTMIAGDTTYIRTGIYREQIFVQSSGEAGAWLTYAAYPGEAPVVDGTGVTVPEYSGLIDIPNRSYVRIIGLTVTNSEPYGTSAGINVDGSDHVLIENNATYNTRSSGIGIWGSRDVVVSGNDVRRCCVQGGSNESISIGTVDRFEVRYNKVHDGSADAGGGEGICIKDGSSNGSVHHNEVFGMNGNPGIYLDAWDKHTFNIEVHTNVVHDMIGANGMAVSSEMGGLLEEVKIFNNLVYGNGLNGIDFGYYGGDGIPSRPVRNVVVANNTFYDNGKSGWGGGITVDNPDAVDIVLRNNIVCSNETYQLNAGVSFPGLMIDHNLIHEFRGFETETRGTEYREAEPGFVGAERADFHLLSGSKAIDGGAPTGAPSVDFDGRARPLGLGYDIGAYEFPSPPDRRRPVRRGF